MAEKAPPPELMKRLTEEDFKRLILLKHRRRNALVGLGLAVGILGVFSFSMLAVKQETFLDDEDFNTPGGGSNSR